MFCASFCASLIASSRWDFLFVDWFDSICSVRVLRLNEIQEVLTFALCKAFLFVFVVVVVVFLSLENYFGFRTTNVRVKMDQT